MKRRVARLRAEAEGRAEALGRPFIVLKVASSLDGRTATRTGQSQWITSPEARARGRELRAALPAICVGVQTVLADDPALTARAPGAQDPLRVVFDSRLRTPRSAQLVRTAQDVPTLIFCTRAADPSRRAALEAAGVQVAAIRKNRAGQVDVRAAVQALARRGVAGLLVEGGATLAGAFADARLVDRVYAFLAPLLIGGAQARPALGGRGAGRLVDGLRLEGTKIEAVGPDWLVSGDVV